MTQNPQFKTIAEQIIEFVRRDMRNESGSFILPLMQILRGGRKFYVWTKQEVVEILGQELGEQFCHIYDITEEGNFEGKNIPNLIHTNEEKAAITYQMGLEELKEQLEQARQKLFEKRIERPFPHVDDKVLTAWNALMIAALAKAGAVFDQEAYIKMAKRRWILLKII